MELADRWFREIADLRVDCWCSRVSSWDGCWLLEGFLLRCFWRSELQTVRFTSNVRGLYLEAEASLKNWNFFEDAEDASITLQGIQKYEELWSSKKFVFFNWLLLGTCASLVNLYLPILSTPIAATTDSVLLNGKWPLSSIHSFHHDTSGNGEMASDWNFQWIAPAKLNAGTSLSILKYLEASWRVLVLSRERMVKHLSHEDRFDLKLSSHRIHLHHIQLLLFTEKFSVQHSVQDLK